MRFRLFPSAIRGQTRRWLKPIVGRFMPKLAAKFYRRPFARAPGLRKNWEEIERAVDGVPNLESFLSSAENIDLYYSALASYFGRANFPRTSFDAILTQIRRVMEEVPTFAERAWKTLGPDERGFAFNSELNGYGREVDIRLWRLYRYSWLSDLNRAGLRGKDRAQAIAEGFKIVRQKTRAVEAQLRLAEVRASERGIPLTRAERRMLRGREYESLRRNPVTRALAASVLFNYLSSDQNQAFFQMNDADMLLHYLRDLRQNPKKVLAGFSILGTMGPLISAIKERIPEIQTLMADKGMFPYRMIRKGRKETLVPGGANSSARYSTHPIRAFHGFWLGIPSNDCLAGDPDSLASLTPVRWAISGILNSRTYVLEKNGAYQGFCRCVPIRMPDGKIYGSVELWAPVLLLPLNRMGGIPTLKEKRQTILSAWLEHYRDILPSEWEALIISDSIEIDNSGVKRNLLADDLWLNAPKLLGVAAPELEDPCMVQVLSMVPPQREALRFADGFVFDAQMNDVHEFRVILG